MHHRRFYVPRESLKSDRAILPPDQAHHLLHVLRLGPGDSVEITDGEGRCYSGTVHRCGPDVVVGSIRLLCIGEEGPRLSVAASLFKADRFEWMLQKGTELGADDFLPLFSRFGEVRIPASRIADRLERWRRIVRESCRQCRRLREPEVHAPVAFHEFLVQASRRKDTKLLFHEAAGKRWLGDLDERESVTLCVGPEGGWHASELHSAVEAGFQAYSLGRRILRAETAAVAAITLVRFQLETRKIRSEPLGESNAPLSPGVRENWEDG